MRYPFRRVVDQAVCGGIQGLPASAARHPDHSIKLRHNPRLGREGERFMSPLEQRETISVRAKRSTFATTIPSVRPAKARSIAA